MPDKDRRRLVLDHLASHAVMTLATAGPEGAAGAAVFYASEGPDLVFLSAPGTLHCRNLLLDPRVAVTIQDDCEDWAAIRGLQMLGTARRLEGAAEQDAKQLYARRFPAVFSAGPTAGPLAAALARISWYRIEASRIRLIDNAAGFGHTDEWSRPAFLR